MTCYQQNMKNTYIIAIFATMLQMLNSLFMAYNLSQLSA